MAVYGANLGGHLLVAPSQLRASSRGMVLLYRSLAPISSQAHIVLHYSSEVTTFDDSLCFGAYLLPAM